MRSLPTLVLSLLVVAVGAQAAPATTETGTLEGASYRADIPADWKKGGGLVVFFHGYSDEPIEYGKDDRLSPMFDPMLREGYAVIQSGYTQPGWAIEQGSADSERLRKWFVAKHGAPAHTFAMGMSMGGTLTVHALETNPEVYDGGLSLCGAIEPSDRMMQRDFAVRAAFDYYFPGVFGELVPVPAGYVADDATARRAAAAMRANPKAAASLRAIYGAGDMNNLPGVIAAITYDVKEMQQRTHGNPFGNADLVYTGSADDDALNDGVKRYRADPRAAAYMARWYTPSGKLGKPLLALHDTRDPLVIASSAFEYALAVQRAGHADNFVQQYVKHEGHCVFTPAQIGKAFDSLVEWTRSGKRPPSGAQP
ncbi:pimeloyl-ACP methyl ester carboxylesterase [Dokdonella fugitiva]|uniref:Pimeloyl-ACP methyl ester carboxylesterase n=1 Tax=Dokdonella fugitiva TaxID=328517 RepID=A0A839F9A9_9GAMM|nr:alpha/beta hydrolase [Dokdonella fugitiva]MBA8888721.1 pimeloyl-ACP methyl ester carboxylesterase [Dokdonella fugitiva]